MKLVKLLAVVLAALGWFAIWALVGYHVHGDSDSQAQLPQVNLLPGCTTTPGGSDAGGTSFNCPGSEWLGGVDYQCGVYVPGEPNKLNCNIGAGDHAARGFVVLSPDVGKGTLLEDGHKHKLVLFRGNQYGGTEFRIQPRFKRGLIACDHRGCIDVMKALRQR